MLIYSMIASLDGYTADADGKFDWAAPDEEVYAFINDLERGTGTYLYGRRMYEVMLYWETVSVEGQSPAGRDYARIWRSADKIVYSATLRVASSARTRPAASWSRRSCPPTAIVRRSPGLRDSAPQGRRFPSRA